MSSKGKAVGDEAASIELTGDHEAEQRGDREGVDQPRGDGDVPGRLSQQLLLTGAQANCALPRPAGCWPARRRPGVAGVGYENSQIPSGTKGNPLSYTGTALRSFSPVSSALL